MGFLSFLVLLAIAYLLWRVTDQMPDLIFRLSEIQRDGGTAVAVDRGRLVGAWADGAPTPLLPAHPAPRAESATTMVDADEAMLLWKWLDAPETEFLHADRPLVAPTPPIPALAVVA